MEACRYPAFVCSAAVLPQALRRRKHRKSSCRSSLRSAVACALGKPYQDLFLSSRLTHALIGQRPPGSDMSIARSVSEDCLCLCMSWVLMRSEGWPRFPARQTANYNPAFWINPNAKYSDCNPVPFNSSQRHIAPFCTALNPPPCPGRQPPAVSIIILHSFCAPPILPSTPPP